MKRSTFLRGFATLALLVVAGLSTFAQYVGPTAATYENVNTDYVTIGSRVPYYVTPDAVISAMVTATSMNPSVFRWQFTANDAPAYTPIAPALTPVQYNGAATTAGGVAGYITQNEISVAWTGAGVTAGSTYIVRATEHSNPLSGVANGCAGDIENRTVIVLPRPTVAWAAATGGGCGITPGAASTFYVPINVTGLGQWQVTYSVTYNGAAYIGATTSGNLGTATVVTSDLTVVADAAATKNILGTPSANTDGIPVIINGGGAAGGYGYYDVTITNVTDRISRKSLDLALVASQVGEIPATTYRIYVNPTPNTTPIQHLQNL